MYQATRHSRLVHSVYPHLLPFVAQCGGIPFLSVTFQYQHLKGTAIMTTRTHLLPSTFSPALYVTRQILAAVAIVSCCVLLGTNMAKANPPTALINSYNQAAQGDEDKVEDVYQQLTSLIKQQGATPLTLVYLGSTETLQGRDAFLPWNKMKYVEKGLATINKGLTLLDSQLTPLVQQERIQGIPESYLTRALAAATYSSLPDMFNHFERGYDLYLALLTEPQFEQQPFAATAWIYRYAIQASLRANDREQAQKWMALMESKDPQNLETETARSLVGQSRG